MLPNDNCQMSENIVINMERDLWSINAIPLERTVCDKVRIGIILSQIISPLGTTIDLTYERSLAALIKEKAVVQITVMYSQGYLAEALTAECAHARLVRV